MGEPHADALKDVKAIDTRFGRQRQRV